MSDSPDDLCPRSDPPPPLSTVPHAAALYLSSVYRCTDPDQADALLSGAAAGYIYVRDGHPNGDLLAEKCRQLHGAERAAICGSGMAALATAALSLLAPGDHVVVSRHLYGRCLQLLTGELARWGVTHTLVDTNDLAATAAAATERTRLVVVETISNPSLHVADLAGLAALAHARGARLLVDNTFAGPVVSRPLEHGADLVAESLTKSMNGHSDVLLGLLCGRDDAWPRVENVMRSYGLGGHPFDCWLAARGLQTLALRCRQACASALAAAQFLSTQRSVARVLYPGLPAHPQHALANKQGGGLFGAMLAFEVVGGREAATKFIHAAEQIPFCPSLGELNTTLSHPESTSHRALSAAERAALGIGGGMIRLSVGIESPEHICAALAQGLAACG